MLRLILFLIAVALAAAGLAIGTAWGGLLANFAAGAFMTILRPFKKGSWYHGSFEHAHRWIH